MSTTAITGGYHASITLPQQGPEVSLAWRVIAEDVAGNELESDYAILRIETTFSRSPVFNAVYTGHAWKRSGQRTRPRITRNASVRTSVRVEFSEGLDPASVEANDFRVDGAAPSDANAFGEERLPDRGRTGPGRQA